MSAKVQTAWPLVVATLPDGRLFVRMCIDRALALKVIKAGGDDDVVHATTPDCRIEVSFHKSRAAAEAALQNEIERGILAGATARGRA